MTSFINYIDYMTWKTVIHGCSPPMSTLEDREAVVPKLKNVWSPSKDEISLANSKALMPFIMELIRKYSD